VRKCLYVGLYGRSVGAFATLAITKGLPLLYYAYEKRYIDPKKAHQQVFLEQGECFEERAAKLAVFRFELTHGPEPDKFKLAQLVSKLDPTDREWTIKETDITLLAMYAVEKAAQCYDTPESAAVTRMRSTTERLFSRSDERVKNEGECLFAYRDPKLCALARAEGQLQSCLQ
jgi:hypothetical protein